MLSECLRFVLASRRTTHPQATDAPSVSSQSVAAAGTVCGQGVDELGMRERLRASDTLGDGALFSGRH